MKKPKRRRGPKPLKPLSNSQESVMSDYKRTEAFKKARAEEGLHMFFSPYRVPVGLTDEEVAICVTLYRLKEALSQKQLDDSMAMLQQGAHVGQALMYYYNKSLKFPDEFQVDKVMTRTRFKQGVYKFLAFIAREL